MNPGNLAHVLQHALGRDEHGRAKHGYDYRNHFCAEPGTDDFDACRRAVALGLMVEREPSDLTGGSHLFRVTEAGKAHVEASSAPAPKMSRGKLRYRAWLGSAAADAGVTFGAWLRQNPRQS